mmetsp:Transcript_116771/g.227069  ORF Transcript_116771/g.227069 Transcript_116771/m.227069 type:complete len:438 (-) Transcript_116771:175-1488(-)
MAQNKRGYDEVQHGHNGEHDHDHSLCDHEHDRPREPKPKLPVTVLTGYLGAGKTTLLNYLLREQGDKKLAVIENEIGEVSIDDALVEQKHQDMAEDLILLDNGCICCTIRQDLMTTLLNISAKYNSGHHLDGVLIELTGMADPAPVVQTFFVNAEVRQAFSVDNVVALVDAKHALDKLDESKGDPEGKGTACAQIAFCSTALLNKVDLADEAELVQIESRLKQLNSTVEIIRCQNAVVPVEKLFNVGAFNLGKVLEEQYMDEEEFSSFYTPKMDRSVSNVGIRCTGHVNMFKFQDFLNHYLGTEEMAKDFLRVKGVLSIAGNDNKFVLQCVHMLRNQAFTLPWADGDPRENRIIFIGRGMQQRRKELTEGFEACLAKPLRFNINSEVQAKTGPGDDDWDNGYVSALWDEFNAYRIRLLRGGEVHAPHDDDAFVRAAD